MLHSLKPGIPCALLHNTVHEKKAEISLSVPGALLHKFVPNDTSLMMPGQHTHDTYSFIIVFGGSITYTIGSQMNRATPGHILLAWSDLRLSKKEISPDEELTVSVKLKNTGVLKGTEIVQLYLRDVYASMTRPVKELQGFARVELEQGQEKTVRLTIVPSQMAFLDEDMRWKIEKGEIEVQIGASSGDIRLMDSFCITGSKWIDGKDRAFYAKAEIVEE